ncbi:hypothetical protein JB92DRAFT_2892772 [Gautieria morchelliformis]|nr:hypothetical protein JB92DRAFT_2892772 [Gautieria morchelliformis]
MQPELPAGNSAPRKQNIACDACRTRKVKCVIVPGQDKVGCFHCQSKSYPCTFNVQRETTEKKRQGSIRRRNSESTTGAIHPPPAFGSLSSSTSPAPIPQPPTYPSSDTSQTASLASFYPSAFHPVSSRPQAQALSLHRPLEASSLPRQPAPPFITSTLSHSPSPVPSPYSETPTTRLLAYLFSPEDPSPLAPYLIQGYRALPDYNQRQPLRMDDWGEVGVKLRDTAFQIEFALDLVEVYFEICHTRIALLSPARFRAQLLTSLPSVSGSHHSPVSPHGSSPASSTSAPPLHPNSQSHLPQRQAQVYSPSVHPAILATVLAWGAKFSEHPLIVLDRSADRTQRSRLAKSLIRKAWEIAEAERIHTVPSADAVIVCLLLDGLHSHDVNDPEGYRGFWLNCGLRHLLHLQINHHSAVPVLIEPERRNTMIYAWWMACLADAYSSLYFRRKPVLEDSDYNIDFYPRDISQIAQSEAEGPGSEKQLSIIERPEFLAWYAASHAMARCAREMSRQLWRPIIRAEGIPFDVLCALISQFNTWRSEYLDKVGVPGTQVNWDFLAAVAACGQDATYHVMWVVLYQALREFGLREVKQSGSNPANHALAGQFVATQARVQKEALNAASRIAGLTNLLTQSSYLRLDPNVMHYNIYAAGRLLAEFGREEVAMCIRGLQQYGVSYDDALDQAAEIQSIYASRRVEPEPAPQAWESISDTDSHHNSYSLPDSASSYALPDSHPMQRSL